MAFDITKIDAYITQLKTVVKDKHNEIETIETSLEKAKNKCLLLESKLRSLRDIRNSYDTYLGTGDN